MGEDMKKMKFGTAFVAASAFALTACGGGADEPDAPAEAADTAAEETDAPAEEPAAEAPAADNTETMDGTTLAGFTADAAAGETVFLQCSACHVVDEGVNRIGPSMYGIVGREAGTVEGYSYSEANANSGITWSPEKLFQYLEDPQRVIPGTKMAFAGLKDGQDRANIIAYLDATDE